MFYTPYPQPTDVAGLNGRPLLCILGTAEQYEPLRGTDRHFEHANASSALKLA